MTREEIRFNPFQGLWKIITKPLGLILKRLVGFNPFQGLWKIITAGAEGAPDPFLCVSIPFRDYGRLSP